MFKKIMAERINTLKFHKVLYGAYLSSYDRVIVRNWLWTKEYSVVIGEVRPGGYSLPYICTSRTYYNSLAEAMNAYDGDNVLLSEATESELLDALERIAR